MVKDGRANVMHRGYSHRRNSEGGTAAREEAWGGVGGGEAQRGSFQQGAG
jgi:hypothetical protein